MSILLAILLSIGSVTVPCEGVVGTVGTEIVQCEALGRVRAESLCRDSARLLRERAVKTALVDAGLFPSAPELKARLDEYVPSKEALLTEQRRQREQTAALQRGLADSQADPLRDREIWQALVSPFMNYPAWVSFRVRMAGKRMADLPDERNAVIDDATFAEARASLTPYVIETVFQEWVIGVWAPAHGVDRPEAWASSLQDHFWTWFTGRTPITRAETLGCGAIVTGDLRGPRVQRPIPQRPGPTREDGARQ
jgi:hypothetical protein